VNFFVMLFKPDQKQEKKAKPAKRGWQGSRTSIQWVCGFILYWETN
jgi:hypothetical protein